MKRESFKDIDIGNRKFRVHKFDALTGSYVIYTVLTQVLPMGLGNQIEELADNAKDSIKSMPIMPKEQFMELQRDCLRACSEIIMTGNTVAPIPILMSDGRWGVEDLSHDAALAMMLTIQVLGYNVKSFFDENVLETFKDSIAQLNMSNA